MVLGGPDKCVVASLEVEVGVGVANPDIVRVLFHIGQLGIGGLFLVPVTVLYHVDSGSHLLLGEGAPKGRMRDSPKATGPIL